MNRPVLLIFTASALLPASANAETYWVSADGAAGWTSCQGPPPLEGAAACSLATANANAVAGDTAYLRAGTYDGQEIRPDHSGTAEDARIIYTNHQDEQVVLSESAYGIYIYQKSYITVDGIDVVSPRRFMRIYASHYVTISHCDFAERSASSGDWSGAIIADDPNDDTSASEDSTHNWVHHCSFYRWVYGAYDEHRGALLNIGTDQSAGDDSSSNLVEDNVFAYGGHHTLGVYAQRNVIRNNYIHNETNAANWDYEGYRGAITEGPSAGRCLYEGNRFGFSDGSGLALRSPNNILRRNLFYRNGAGGIQVVSNNYPSDRADENYIYHNSFFHNGHLATYGGFQGGMYFSDWGGASPADNVIKNNIFFDSRNGSISYDGNVDPQVIEGNWDDNATDPGFLDLSGTDPDDPSLPDLHLADDSAAKDQALWLTTITSADGTAATFTVADAGYFMDGFDVIDGDLVQLADSTQTARIVEVDYDTHTLTVDQPLTFTSGQGISLAFVDAAADQGAYEIGADPPPQGGAGGSGGSGAAGGAGGSGTGGSSAGAGPQSVPTDDGGCGCRLVAPRRSEPRVPLALLLAIGALAWIRRRSEARPVPRPRPVPG